MSVIVRRLVCCLLFIGCASGQCRRDGTPVPSETDIKTISEQELENEVILIGKSDNSLQCGYNVGVTMENMAEELNGIKILKSEKKNDGLMRIQSCGAPTGMMNVYHIYRKDVKKAVKLGYKVLDTAQ
jgi:hypothetical protein